MLDRATLTTLNRAGWNFADYETSAKKAEVERVIAKRENESNEAAQASVAFFGIGAAGTLGGFLIWNPLGWLALIAGGLTVAITADQSGVVAKAVNTHGDWYKNASVSLFYWEQFRNALQLQSKQIKKAMPQEERIKELNRIVDLWRNVSPFITALERKKYEEEELAPLKGCKATLISQCDSLQKQLKSKKISKAEYATGCVKAISACLNKCLNGDTGFVTRQVKEYVGYAENAHFHVMYNEPSFPQD